jgi:hypothetical protein
LPNSIEKARLSLPPHGKHNNSTRLRLSCQIRLPTLPPKAQPSQQSHKGHDVTVDEESQGDPAVVLELVKYEGFWGEQLTESRESAGDFKMPLGELEYILDRDRNRDRSKPQL